MKKSPLYHLFISVLSFILLFAEPVWALTVDQVINLRRAGISNKTIAIMLENETKVRKRGGVGRYAVRNSQGGEVIVYQASTPKGVQDFPLGIRANAGGVDRMSVVLGAEKRTPPQKTSKNNKRGFSLHLASFKRKDYADAEMKKLRQNGVQARLTQVDLGGKGKWYRLMVGDYNTQKAAGAAAEILKNQGKIKSFRIVSQ